MKKLLFLLLLACASIGACAQNANRTGFFMELSYGGCVGYTNVNEVTWTGSSVEIQPLTCSAFKLDLGPRIRLGRFLALDVNVGLQGLIQKSFENLSVGGGLALRFTSPELFKNMSLYASAGAGYYRAITHKKQHNIDIVNDAYGYQEATEPGVYKIDHTWGWLPLSFKVGLNFTNHLYGGLIFDYSVVGAGHNLLGAQVGYRF